MTDPDATDDGNAPLLEWLDENALDPAELGSLVGDARVVAIGESAHGVHEFYELKDRLLRHLVAELGFTAFAMEAGLPEGMLVDEWARGASTELKEVLHRGVTYNMGGNEDMRSQLEWMRSWNDEHPERPVRFYGMDVPGSAVDGRPAIKSALEFLQSVDPTLAEELQAKLDAGFGWIEELEGPAAVLEGYSQLDRAIQTEMAALVCDLETQLRAMKVRYGEASTPEAAELAHRCGVVARQWQGFISSMTRGSGARDAAMAENVAWILEREDRIVIGAHNGHVQRVPLGAPFPPMTPLGQHLASVLGDELLVIGTTMAGGQVANHRKTGPGPADFEMFLDDLPPPEPPTIDALLASRGSGTYALDLRKIPTSGPVADRFLQATAIRVNHSPVSVDVLRAFDLLVHFDEVHPVERIPK